MVLNLSENLQRQVNLLVRKLARKNELMQEIENELAQSKARIRELEEEVKNLKKYHNDFINLLDPELDAIEASLESIEDMQLFTNVRKAFRQG